MCELTFREKLNIIKDEAYKYMGLNSDLWQTVLQHHDFEKFLSGSMYGSIKTISTEKYVLSCMASKIGQIKLIARDRSFNICAEYYFDNMFERNDTINVYDAWEILVVRFVPEIIEQEYNQVLNLKKDNNIKGICAVIPGNSKDEIINNLKILLKELENNPIYIGGCCNDNFDYSAFDKEINYVSEFVEYFNNN